MIAYNFVTIWELDKFLLTSLILTAWAGVQGIAQNKIKKFLAYTFIFNNIFLLLPMLTNNISNVIGTFLFYLVNILLTFSVLIQSPINNISHFTVTDKNLALILSLSLFSSVGVPPLSGFLVKALPFSELNNILMLILIIILCGFLFYYLRLIAALLFYTPQKKLFICSSNFNIFTAGILYLNMSIFFLIFS
jgi:NADH-quinone oxidoreductase subunit N